MMTVIKFNKAPYLPDTEEKGEREAARKRPFDDGVRSRLAVMLPYPGIARARVSPQRHYPREENEPETRE